MRIAHISAHLGGGVGSVLRSFFELSTSLGAENDLYCLDKCDSNFTDLTKISSSRDGLAFDATWSFEHATRHHDVVLVHYWNHPLTARFLAHAGLSSNRAVVWTHNSGLFEPHTVPGYLAGFAEKILFTSSCSFMAPNLVPLIRERPGKFDVVHSTHSLDAFLNVGAVRGRRRVRNLLYVGTVSDSKLHPRSAEIFASLSRIGYSVRIVGGPDHTRLAERISRLGGNAEVLGAVSDVTRFYDDADVFVYPLRRDHYGTGEQVVLEAMASGLPVVAFNNPAESAILRDGGGLLADSLDELIALVEELSTSAATYQEISMLGRQRVSVEFSAQKMTETLIRHFTELSDTPRVGAVHSGRISELDVYALNSFFDGDSIVDQMGKEADRAVDIVFSKIEPHLHRPADAVRWLDASKSTPFHYLRYFPNSADFTALCQKLEVTARLYD